MAPTEPVPVASFTARRNPRPTTVHLGRPDGDGALCGVHRGQPVPAVPARLCSKCVYRYHLSSGRARKIARDGADAALREHIASVAEPAAEPVDDLRSALTDLIANTGYLGELGRLDRAAKEALADIRRHRKGHRP